MILYIYKNIILIDTWHIDTLYGYMTNDYIFHFWYKINKLFKMWFYIPNLRCMENSQQLFAPHEILDQSLLKNFWNIKGNCPYLWPLGTLFPDYLSKILLFNHVETAPLAVYCMLTFKNGVHKFDHLPILGSYYSHACSCYLLHVP